MADIFDEIDEELRQDRQAVLWQRYGKYVMAVAGLIIVLVGARQAYIYWAENRDSQAANSYNQAAAIDDAGEALTQITDDLTDGYQILAAFSVAGKLSDKGSRTQAETAYLALSEQTDIAPVYRDIAVLLSVMHADENADKEALLVRLEPLTQSAGPVQGLALEQAAALELELGRLDKAIDKLKIIISLAEVPASLRQRAAQFLSVISPSGSGDS